MHEQASSPNIFNGIPLQIELKVAGPIHIHQHGDGVTADDITLLAYLESRLKRSAARLKKLDDQIP